MDIKRFFGAVFCFLISLPAIPASAGFDEMAEDTIEVFIRLGVSLHSETRFKAGNPPRTVGSSSEVSFTREGEWVFYHIKEEFGGGYFALPRGGEFWPITGVSAIENHICLNDEGMIIGENSHSCAGGGNPALGGVSLHMGEDGKLRLRLAPVRIDTKITGCGTQYCIGNFGGGFNVGENREPGDSVYGHDIAVVHWDSLKRQQDLPAVYDDDFPPLVPIPSRYMNVHRSQNADKSRVLKYTVISWIGAAGKDWTTDPETSPGIGDDLTLREKMIGIPVYPGLECAGFIPAGAVPAGGGESLPIVSGTTDDSVDSVVDFFNEKLPGWHYHEGHIRYFIKEEGCEIARPGINACVHVRVHPPAWQGQPVVVQYFYKE